MLLCSTRKDADPRGPLMGDDVRGLVSEAAPGFQDNDPQPASHKGSVDASFREGCGVGRIRGFGVAALLPGEERARMYEIVWLTCRCGASRIPVMIDLAPAVKPATLEEVYVFGLAPRG